MSDNMRPFWSQRIRDAVPYVPGEQPRDRKFIKLNTNENPYPPSPKALDAIRAAADDSLRLYPDPECLTLRRAVARRYGLREDQVFCGNGSDEILAFCFQAFFDPKPGVMFADVTYSFYPVYAGYFGLTYELAPTGSLFELPIEAYETWPGGVVIANPNAPTGAPVSLADLGRILAARPDRVVVVDEAYVDFGGESAVALLDEFPNLVVVHTLSKSRSLAGLRVGWALGDQNLMDALRCVRDSINSYTVDRLAMAGAAAAVEDEVYFRETCRKVTETRAWTAEALERLGFEVLPSRANFLFVRHPDHGGKELLDGLRARGVLVRWWADPRISDYIRISIGTDADMKALTAALADYMDREG